MYKCLECGYIFDEPKKVSEDLTPGGVFEGGSFINEYHVCPRCNGAYDDVRVCNCCGDLFTYDEGTIRNYKFYCYKCLDEFDSEEDL